MYVKKTKARISYTLFWLGLKQDCQDFIKTCRICQMKSRVTYRDRVPIKPIPRADRVFDHFLLIVLDPEDLHLSCAVGSVIIMVLKRGQCAK